MTKRRIPSWAWTTLKLAVAACIIGWMFRAGVIRVDDLRSAGSRWPFILLGLACVLACIMIQSVRWGFLLRAQGIRLGFWRLYALMMTGFFFTIVAPGGLGGDAVKAFYVARGQTKKAEAATTVFLDRFLGLATLFFVAGIMIVVDFRNLWNLSTEKGDVAGIPFGRVLVIAVGACAASMALFAVLVMSKRLRRTGLLGRLARFVPFRQAVRKVYEALHLYGDHPRELAWAAAASIIAQVPLYAAYYLYGLAVGVDIKPWHCALIVAPAMVIRVLPLVPAGAGQGMAAMALLFPLVGIQEGAAIGAIGDAVFIIVCLMGGAFFVLEKSSYGAIRAAAETETP